MLYKELQTFRTQDLSLWCKRSAGCARAADRQAGDGGGFSKLRAVYGKWAWLVGR